MECASRPDGGYGWVIVLLSIVLFMLESSSYSVYGVILLDVVEHFQVNRTTVTWIGAINMMVIGIGGKCLFFIC